MDSDPHRLLADDPLRASPRRPRSKGGATHTCAVCHSLTIPAVRTRVQRVTDDQTVVLALRAGCSQVVHTRTCTGCQSWMTTPRHQGPWTWVHAHQQLCQGPEPAPQLPNL